MTASKEILKIVPTMQSLALAKKNYNMVKKKKLSAKDFVKQGMENVVGTSLIKETADFVSLVD